MVDAPTEAEILACLKKEELDELDVSSCYVQCMSAIGWTCTMHNDEVACTYMCDTFYYTCVVLYTFTYACVRYRRTTTMQTAGYSTSTASNA